MLNILWPLIIIISFVFSIITGTINETSNGIFISVTEAVKLTITLIGTVSVWNGIIEILKNTSLIKKLNLLLKPLIRKLFPNIKNNKKAEEEVTMNIIANLLGLGNASTPLGLKAMNTLQLDNNGKDSLSDSMIMLIVLNTASLQIIPTNVIAIRNGLNSSNPSGIIMHVWISTLVAAFVGIVATKILLRKGKK